MSRHGDASQLQRVLGTWDLVLLNVAAIVSLRWLSTAAQIGPSSLLLWTMGLLFFFLPLAFAVLELSARVPGEGGLYLWAKAGFGDIHGFVAGWSYWVRFGSATPFTAVSVMPDFGARSTYAAFAIIAGALSGLELGPIMGGEIRDPARQLRRAALIAGGIVTIIYMAGTASLLVALPTATIDVIGGIPQALAAIGERIGVPFFGALTAGLLALAAVGSFGAFLSGTARLPFVVGLDRYLPKALARLHPRYGSPYVALLTQSACATLVFAAAMSGATVHEAFVVLIDMTLILSMLPLLYIFAAFPVLRHRATRSDPGASPSPLGTLACWLTGAVGFSTTLLGIIFSMVPPANDPNPRLFLLKVGGGCVFLVGIGLTFYWRGTRRSHLTNSRRLLAGAGRRRADDYL